MMFYLDESESINNHFIQNKKELSIFGYPLIIILIILLPESHHIQFLSYESFEHDESHK